MIEIERQILSTLLLEPSRFKELPQNFQPSWFETSDYRNLFEKAQELYLESGTVDVVSIAGRYPNLGELWVNITTPPTILNGSFNDTALTLDPGKKLQGESFPEMTAKDLADILSLTIKADYCEKIICFQAMLSTYSGDPLNLAFHAASSSGKSYIATEIAKLFPAEDVKKLGYCSPTAFFHDSATFDEIRKVSVVDLERKILVFLDMPHHQVSERLRPFLSHDDKEISVKITDRGRRGENRTKNILIKGFSAVVFCSANGKLDEQESTRFILLSPETGQEKIRDAVKEKLKLETDPVNYRFDVESDPRRMLLKKRIEAVRAANISQINIGNPELLEERFLSRRKILKPRHSRDMAHIIGLVKTFALLNLWTRDNEDGIIISNERDIEAAFSLWESIGKAQELGLPPAILDIYEKVFVWAYREKNPKQLDGVASAQGLTRREIIQAYSDTYGRPLPDYILRREVIPMLETAGLIVQDADKDDKRRMLVFVSGGNYENGK